MSMNMETKPSAQMEGLRRRRAEVAMSWISLLRRE
jgi:hypothetical protein